MSSKGLKVGGSFAAPHKRFFGSSGCIHGKKGGGHEVATGRSRKRIYWEPVTKTHNRADRKSRGGELGQGAKSTNKKA